METAKITIEPFRPDDADAFRALNEAWICAHFALEHEDELVLNHPEEYILRNGGEIFIARSGGEAVGCCALVVKSAGVLELAKMAVDARHQGRGIGRKLLNHAVQRAKSRGAAAIVLASNTRLLQALHLYETSGFRRLKSEQAPALPYERANVFMRMDLADAPSQDDRSDLKVS